MEKKEQIKQVVRDFHVREPVEVRSRDVDIPVGSGKIISLIGARRSGKTSVLFDTINGLTEETEKTKILYLNFEDERLDLSTPELDLILQAYRELYPHNELESCYVFFDEIQNVTGWERFVRRVYDTETKNIFITGSNSKLLSTEIATSLRGRTLTREVFPLSFSEYLRFKDISPDLYSSRHLPLIHNAQVCFLEQGAFPETVFIDERFHIDLLQDYFDVLLYRDIVERYNITNLTALKYFLKRVFASNTRQISVHKIYNELKSAGIKVGKNTLYDFLDAALSVYLAFVLPRYDKSLVSRELGERKIYTIDPGLCSAVEYKFSADHGKALENAVFLELRRKKRELFYYSSDTAECDFLIADRGKVLEAVQVCFDITDENTREREIKGLVEACERFGLDNGIVVTSDTSDNITIGRMNIRVVPFYTMFLEEQIP